MIIRQLKKERKRIFLYTLIVYIILSVVYLAIAVILQINKNEIRKTEIIKNEERLVNLEKNILSNKIDSLISDLLFIADNLNFKNYDDNGFADIEKELKSFSNRKKIYNQIRYIDVDGNEKIRIDYLENDSVIINGGELQNKKDRYYFKDTIKLEKGQIYVSKLDLNIENGKIEKPIKPMVRLSTKVFGKDGTAKGIVILNYYAQNLLRDFGGIAETSVGDVFLLDSNGYYIYNSKYRDKEWTFMYENKKDISFKNDFPEKWSVIQKSEKNTVVTLKDYYSYENIMTISERESDKIENDKNSIVLGEGNWIAVSSISLASENGDILFANLYQNILYTVKRQKINLLLILIVSVNFGILIILNKLSKERTKYFSEYDSMTGTFNRRAGFELLDKTYRNGMNNGEKVSVCFIDINGLKDVNDNLGHEAGDELIVSVVDAIKKHIQKSDFITRIGGDEFLIIFVNANLENAESVWSKINDEYKKINELENRKYIVSASHGIEEFKFNANEDIDKIINLADEKMYNEKKFIKKDLVIVRKKSIE